LVATMKPRPALWPASQNHALSPLSALVAGWSDTHLPTGLS